MLLELVGGAQPVQIDVDFTGVCPGVGAFLLGFRCGCSSNASYFRFFCNLKLHGIRMFRYMVIMIKELYDSERMLLIKKKYFC